MHLVHLCFCIYICMWTVVTTYVAATIEHRTWQIRKYLSIVGNLGNSGHTPITDNIKMCTY